MSFNQAPNGMRQSAWDYLLSFTEKHEALVLCMYDNAGVGQDVTVGIGTKLFDEDFIRRNAWVKDMFHDKDNAAKAITVEDVIADFNKAKTIPRVGNVDPTTHLIPEYAGLQLRTTRDKAVERMAVRLAGNLADMLRGAHGHWFDEFPNFPADAQVGCVSFSYGRPAWDYRLLRQAIGEWNFMEAADQVWIKQAAFLKNVAHQTLFWNAACVVQQQKDFNRVWSQPPEDPARLPWHAWTERVIDLDANTDVTTTHDVEQAKPKFKEPPPQWLRKQFPGDFKP